jgi:hypothetical protein
MSSDQADITVRVLASDQAEATFAASSLREHILDSVEYPIEATLVKEDARTQDVGSTLVFALGAPVLVALARGISEWIRRRKLESTIELAVNGNRVRLSGDIADHPQHVESLMRALQSKAVDR